MRECPKHDGLGIALSDSNSGGYVKIRPFTQKEMEELECTCGLDEMKTYFYAEEKKK